MNTIDPKFDLSCITNVKPDFISLEKNNQNSNYNLFSIDKIQSYNPILSLFQYTTKENIQNTSFNHKYHFLTLDTVLENSTDSTIPKPVFIKCSPLINPTKYLVGK